MLHLVVVPVVAALVEVHIQEAAVLVEVPIREEVIVGEAVVEEVLPLAEDALTDKYKKVVISY